MPAQVAVAIDTCTSQRQAALDALPEALGTVNTLLVDADYFSKTNVEHCLELNMLPYISAGHDTHNQPLNERFTEPAPLPGT